MVAAIVRDHAINLLWKLCRNLVGPVCMLEPSENHPGTPLDPTDWNRFMKVSRRNLHLNFEFRPLSRFTKLPSNSGKTIRIVSVKQPSNEIPLETFRFPESTHLIQMDSLYVRWVVSGLSLPSVKAKLSLVN